MIDNEHLAALFEMGQEITIHEHSPFWRSHLDFDKDTKFTVLGRHGGTLIVYPLPPAPIMQKFFIYVTSAEHVKIPPMAFTNPSVMAALVRFYIRGWWHRDTVAQDVENYIIDDPENFHELEDPDDDYEPDPEPDHP